MGASLEIGGSGAVDGPLGPRKSIDMSPAYEGLRIHPPAPPPDPYDDHHREFSADPDLSGFIEQGLVKDSVNALVGAGATLLARHALPGFGGHVVHAVLEARKAAEIVEDLTTREQQPELELPLPSPLPHLDLSVKALLTRGEKRREDCRVMFCMDPVSPSSTGAWAREHDDQVPRLVTRVTDVQDVSLSELTMASAIACVAETDLGRLRIEGSPEDRARTLAGLAAQCAPQLRADPHLERFAALIVADKGRGSGLWVRLR